MAYFMSLDRIFFAAYILYSEILHFSRFLKIQTCNLLLHV
jgi:hypothetical protein